VEGLPDVGRFEYLFQRQATPTRAQAAERGTVADMTIIAFISSVIAVAAFATWMRRRHRKLDNMHQPQRKATSSRANAGFVNHH